jgi:hypothetical protein
MIDKFWGWLAKNYPGMPVSPYFKASAVRYFEGGGMPYQDAAFRQIIEEFEEVVWND